MLTLIHVINGTLMQRVWAYCQLGAFLASWQIEIDILNRQLSLGNSNPRRNNYGSSVLFCILLTTLCLIGRTRVFGMLSLEGGQWLITVKMTLHAPVDYFVERTITECMANNYVYRRLSSHMPREDLRGRNVWHKNKPLYPIKCKYWIYQAINVKI